MLATDENALLCDMAETYHIFESWEETEMPIARYALFAAGLRSNSRIKLLMNDSKVEFETLILAGIFDAVNWLKWSKTVDAEHNENRPKSIVNRILNGDTEQTEEVTSDGRVLYESPEAFEREYEKLRLEKMRGVQNE